MNRKMNVSVRLTLWYSLMLLIALSAFGVLAYLFIARQQFDEQSHLLLETGEKISEFLETKNGELEHVNVREINEELNLDEFGIFFEIFDETGKSFYRSLNSPQFSDQSAYLFEREEAYKIKDVFGFTFRVQSSPVRVMGSEKEDFTQYYILVGQSILYVTRILHRIRNLLLVLTPVLLIFAGFGGWYLARRALKPVSDITNAAREISMRHLNMRLPVSRQNDELGQLSKTFNEMIERIQTGVMKLQQFTADASHELRTPLTVMRGEIEVALRKPRENKDYRKVLRSSLQEIHRMEKIVNDLLFLSRADAGKIQFQNENVDLNRLIRETLPGIKKLAGTKRISLNFNTGNFTPICRIDPDKFRQVVTNVLDNAIKYTPENGRVDIRLFREQGSFVVTVTDNGIGIPEEEIPFVFDRFYRVDKARSHEQNSTGLGLSICKWIVEAYGGGIEIGGAVDRGTTVKIILPENRG